MSTTKLRRCVGSRRFGIEAHEAPEADFPKQPSQPDGLGRMCRSHWREYTAGLRKHALARKGGEPPNAEAPTKATAADRKTRKTATKTTSKTRSRKPSPKPQSTVRLGPSPFRGPIRLASIADEHDSAIHWPSRRSLGVPSIGSVCPLAVGAGPGRRGVGLIRSLSTP